MRCWLVGVVLSFLTQFSLHAEFSVELTGLKSRQWTDKKMRIVHGVLTSMSSDGQTLFIKREDTGSSLKANFSGISDTDQSYVRNEARKNGYVFYDNRYVKVSGCLDEMTLCVFSEDAKLQGIPDVMVIRIDDLEDEDADYMRKLLKNGKFVLGNVDKEEVKKLEDYIIACSIHPEVETYVCEEYPDCFRVLKYASKQFDIKVSLYQSKCGFENCIVDISGNNPLPLHHEWHIGVRKDPSGRSGGFERYCVARMSDAVRLLWGWYGEHKKEACADAKNVVRRSDVDYYSTPKNNAAAIMIRSIEGSVPGRGVAKRSGTAVAICSDGYLLTCFHVVKGARNVLVKTPFWDEWADVVAVDAKLDVAVLKIARTIPAAAVCVDRKLSNSDYVISFGYPEINNQGMSIKTTEGAVKNTESFGADDSCFEMTATVYHGNSGGPVFDESGLLCGLVKSGIMEKSRFACVRMDRIIRFLQLNLPGKVSDIHHNSVVPNVDIDQLVRMGRKVTDMVVIYE